jgi:Xaa-Pro aminopeptidase
MKGRMMVGMAAAAMVCVLIGCAQMAHARFRQPNSEYQQRRYRLASKVDAPVVIFGYTGHEDASEVAVFFQEESFYYLTGHSEAGAALILLPKAPNAKAGDGPSETLYLPARDPRKERWEGPQMGPNDPGVSEKTGFVQIRPFDKMEGDLQKLSATYSNFYTLIAPKEEEGYPHLGSWNAWLHHAVPSTKLRDVSSEIFAMRQVKSAGELALLQKAVDLSVDAHLDAMKRMRAGLFEYQVASRMKEIHEFGGCAREAYSPIVGAGFNSTVLHYPRLDSEIQDGDVVVIDVAGEYGGYAADITRTLPANGKFTARQREIYEIVLGAQNAALAAIKPGMDYCQKGAKSVYKISYDYINSHGKDLHGKALGQYYIHGLGHDIGLDVHDPGEYCKPLEPGMVVTVEPGIYIPEENLGVRIEDDILITETGYKFLSERLPRNPDEIEKIMAEAKKQRAPSRLSNEQPHDDSSDIREINALIARYARSVSDADTDLASQIWWNSPEVSFIHPLGHERGFEQIKQNVYEKLMGGTFSERKLSPREIAVHVYGDSAVAEFYWDFVAKLKKDGSTITTHGRETQIYERKEGAWRLVHVHYSGMPAAPSQGF